MIWHFDDMKENQQSLVVLYNSAWTFTDPVTSFGSAVEYTNCSSEED